MIKERRTMKKLAIVLAASVIGSAALAQTTTVIREGGGTVVKERSVDVDTDEDVVVKRKVRTTGSVGCKSKTTAKTDEFGDTTVKKKVKC
jgi:hypothetical protein